MALGKLRMASLRDKIEAVPVRVERKRRVRKPRKRSESKPESNSRRRNK